MSVQDASMAVPAYDIDKIIYAGSGSGTGLGTSLLEPGLPIGIYTLDGGTTWNDCANYNFSGSFTIEPSTSTNIFLEADPTNPNPDQQIASFTNSAQAKFCVLAIPGITYLTSTFFTSGETLYRSQDSYLKIAEEGSYDISASSYQTTTIAHNLGYVPLANVWVESDFYGSSGEAIFRIFNNFNQSSNSGVGVTLDENNIYIHTEPGIYISNSTVTIYYRIYHEN